MVCRKVRVSDKLRQTVCKSFSYRQCLLPEYHRASIRHNSLAGVYECVSVYDIIV